jgi:hypothetical protein
MLKGSRKNEKSTPESRAKAAIASPAPAAISFANFLN